MWVIFLALELFLCILTSQTLYKSKKKVFYIINFSTSIGLIIVSLICILFANLDYTTKQLVLIHIVLTTIYVFILAIIMMIDYIFYKKTPHREQNGNADKKTPTTSQVLSNAAEPNMSFEEMKKAFFDRWHLDWQCNPEQRKRLERAKTDTIYRLFDINPDNGTANCHSSNLTNINKVYRVTFKTCTCPDYQDRHYPCKHIYALVLNLGIMQDDIDLSGIPKEIKDKMDLLPANIANYFWSILRRNDYRPFIIKKSSSSKPLLALELIKDTENPSILLDMLFSRNDLVAKIYENSIDYKPNTKTTKSEIINHIITNEPEFVKKIIKNNIRVVLNDEVARCRQNICDYYYEHSENAHLQN